jgi:predicted component of type VI protein secretion system
MPSVSSMPSAGGAEHVDSIPPLPTRRILPFVLLAAVVAGTVLLFVVAVVSSSSWFRGSDDPVVAPEAATISSSPLAQPLEPKADPPAPSVEPSGPQDKAPDASASENDQNGGSLEVRTVAPPVTAPPRVPVPGTRAAPYLPDLP